MARESVPVVIPLSTINTVVHKPIARDLQVPKEAWKWSRDTFEGHPDLTAWHSLILMICNTPMLHKIDQCAMPELQRNARETHRMLCRQSHQTHIEEIVALNTRLPRVVTFPLATGQGHQAIRQLLETETFQHQNPERDDHLKQITPMDTLRRMTFCTLSKGNLNAAAMENRRWTLAHDVGRGVPVNLRKARLNAARGQLPAKGRLVERASGQTVLDVMWKQSTL
jgi:hypothetical protein